MAIRLAAVDIDGTLLNSRGILAEETARTICETGERGIFIVPSTGRCWDEYPDSLAALEVVRYAIFSNGARIVDLKTDRTLYSNFIPYEDVLSLLPLLLESGFIYELIYEGSVFIDEAFMAPIYASFREAGEGYLWFFEKIRFVRDLPGEIRNRKMDAEKISIRRVDSEYRKKCTALLREKQLYTVTDFYGKPGALSDVEITVKNCSKGTALSALCDMLEIPAEEILAIGDGHNDISMVEMAGMGIAMGNATAGVKEAAQYITLSNDDLGAALALRKFAK